jgi:N-acetylmuramoyl-L-alanine amidase
MKKILSAICIVLTLTFVSGVCVQAAPLLPGENEINGAQTEIILPDPNEISDEGGQYEEPAAPIILAEPETPAATQTPVATETTTTTPAPAASEDAQVLGATDGKTLKIAFNGNVNRKLIPILINGVTYVPFRIFCMEAVPGAVISWNSENKTAYCDSQALDIEVPFDKTYIIANGRVLFRYDKNIAINETIYVPVRSLATAIGAYVEWNASEKLVNLVLTGKPITPASQYYNQNDLLWLARIINAESQSEPLIGKIAVGDVILNRVAHPDFPDTVYDVVFDNRYAIQFHPVTSPVIYNTPSEESIIAAKACLEGFSVSKTILYFMNPRIAVSNWIARNRSFVMAIGNHSFYA